MRMLEKLYGDRAHEVLDHPWQVVKSVHHNIYLCRGLDGCSVWRPLKGTVRDWPLALCDAQSFDYERDGEPGDIVYKDWATENVQVNYSPLQQWYWLPEQTVSELLIFKSADSRNSTCQGQ